MNRTIKRGTIFVHIVDPGSMKSLCNKTASQEYLTARIWRRVGCLQCLAAAQFLHNKQVVRVLTASHHAAVSTNLVADMLRIVGRMTPENLSEQKARVMDAAQMGRQEIEKGLTNADLH